MKIALIGAGLIGESRIKAIKQLQNEKYNLTISAVYDPAKINDKAFVEKYNIIPSESLEALYSTDPDWIFIALPHNIAVQTTVDALKNGKKVLIEKPLGRNLKEAKYISEQADDNQLFVGFNYRFFDGINKAISDIRKKKFGDVISVNFVLGHGCEPNITKTWKLDLKSAGGGCLIDPGIHLLDLVNLVSDSDLEILGGSIWEGFWQTGIDEEAHILFRSKSGVIFNLQVSIVRWRSTFKFEINGTEGYGIVEGRGRSYGAQTYTFGKRWGWLEGISQRESENLVLKSDGDNVFYNEIKALLFNNNNAGINVCNSKEAIKNMELLEETRKALGVIQ